MGYIMDGMDAEAYDREYSDQQLLNRILTYFRPHRKAMGIVALLIVLNSIMDAAFPFLIARSLDQLHAASDLEETIWHRTAWIIIAVFMTGALSWTFNFFRQRLTARTIGDVVLKLRQDAFDAVLARDMSFYDEYSTGKIVSRVTSDTQDFSNVVTLTLNLISQVLIVTIVVGLLIFINLRLALITLVIAPVVIFIALAFRRIARKTTCSRIGRSSGDRGAGFQPANCRRCKRQAKSLTYIRNNRFAFAVVCSANVPNDTPRSSARHAAV